MVLVFEKALWHAHANFGRIEQTIWPRRRQGIHTRGLQRVADAARKTIAELHYGLGRGTGGLKIRALTL